MFLKLATLFIVVPAVELYLLIRLGGVIGAGWTVVLIFATGALGAALARREGLRAWAGVNQALARGELPAAQLVEAALVVAAGLVLLTPGLLTDAAGFLLLVPSVRAWAARLLIAYFRRRIIFIGQQGMGPRGPFPREESTIETTARVLDEEEER